MRVLLALFLLLSVAWSWGDEDEDSQYCQDGTWSDSGYEPCAKCTECESYFKTCRSWRDAVCMEPCAKTCHNGGTLVGGEDMRCTCTCAPNYYGAECEVHNPHTDVAEFELTDPVSNIGTVNDHECGTKCPFWVDTDYKQDGPYRCVRERYWGTDICLLCGAAGLDLIDNNTGEPITEYCETKTCEEGIIITDSHVDKSKADGQTASFHPECADRFFEHNFGSKKWSGKGIDLNNFGTQLLWFWNEGKRPEECGEKACVRRSRSKSKPGDFTVGTAITKVYSGYNWNCNRDISVDNNYPALYKKNGQYFSFDEDCMNTLYGSDDWHGKVLTVSKNRLTAKQFKIKLFKKSKFFNGLSVGRQHPSSKVEKYFWNVDDEVYIHTPCKGSFGTCDSNCLKSYTITTPRRGNGEECPYDTNDKEICEVGEGACLKTCGCPAQNNPVHFVCGEDGNTYRNTCQAECMGTTVSNWGPCECMIVDEEEEDDNDYGGEDNYYNSCNYNGCENGLECIDGHCQACPRSTPELPGRCEAGYVEREEGTYTMAPNWGCCTSCPKFGDFRPGQWCDNGCVCICQPEDYKEVGLQVGTGMSISAVSNNMALIALGCVVFAGGYYLAVRKKNSISASYEIM